MKKIINLFVLYFLIMCFGSCEMVNYDELKVTFEEVLYDYEDNPPQTALGTSNEKIRIMETSYAHGNPNIVVIP